MALHDFREGGLVAGIETTDEQPVRGRFGARDPRSFVPAAHAWAGGDTRGGRGSCVKPNRP
jgi:hypothetical protein